MLAFLSNDKDRQKRLPTNLQLGSRFAEFRRIYGVVFRASLHGEANIYLLILRTAAVQICNDLHSKDIA